MPHSLQVRPEAIADIDRALAHYAAIRIELVVELQAEFDHCFELVSERPLSFQVHADAIRRMFLNRFPYGIFYVIDDSVVVELAVFHLADDPEKLEKRLKRDGG